MAGFAGRRLCHYQLDTVDQIESVKVLPQTIERRHRETTSSFPDRRLWLVGLSLGHSKRRLIPAGRRLLEMGRPPPLPATELRLELMCHPWPADLHLDLLLDNAGLRLTGCKDQSERQQHANMAQRFFMAAPILLRGAQSWCSPVTRHLSL